MDVDGAKKKDAVVLWGEVDVWGSGLDGIARQVLK